MKIIINLILCHLLGDYVLQIDFIAKTKGNNFYHLLVHCVLYCLPFYILFGLVWQLIPLLLLHIRIMLLLTLKIVIQIGSTGS